MGIILRIRRSMLFVPGDKPAMLEKASKIGADSIILDLEDSVIYENKDFARTLVINTVKKISTTGIEVIVRINSPSSSIGLNDIKMVAREMPYALMIPKAKEGDIRTVCDLLLNVEREINIQAGSIKLFPIIETAYGLENAHSIISSSHRIIGVLFGAEDFLADMGVTGAATESILSYARIGVAVACRASDIDSIDTPYLDIGDDKGLFTETRKAKSAGMTGKAAIHPNQIEIIHQIYAPSQDEVEHAKKIIEMSKIMAAEGKGAFLVNGKMVDAPIIKKALNIVQKAELTGTR